MTRRKTELEKFKNSPWSIIITKGKNIIYRSNMSGLSPLMQAINQLNGELAGASVYDRIIGRAAAFLLVHASVRSVYTPLVSRPAIEILRSHKIPVVYLAKVDRIMDREMKDLCPMEKLSLDADTPMEFIRLVNRLHVTTI